MAIDYVYFYSIEFAKLIIRYRVLDLWLRVLCGEFLDFFAVDYSGRSAHALKRVQRMGIAV